MPNMPTLPLLFGVFLTNQSMVSQASELSSVSLGPLLGLKGRMWTKVPSEPNRPRTSWETMMKRSLARAAKVPSGSL